MLCIRKQRNGGKIILGCDIHVCCEFKNYQDMWINCDHFKLNPYYEEWEEKYKIVPIYDDRNYALFATLADVRNYGNTIPISKTRGLPNDIHPLTKRLADVWECDGHSYSYYTLKELLDYMDTSPTVTYSGLITTDQARDLDEYHIYPDSWCQWTTIEGYVKRSWTIPDDNLKYLIDAMKKRCAEVFYIHKESNNYESRIRRVANDFRIVFWFDN